MLAVGPKVRENIRVTDTVILSDYAGAPCTFTIDGVTIDATMVPEREVLMVVEGM